MQRPTPVPSAQPAGAPADWPRRVRSSPPPRAATHTTLVCDAHLLFAEAFAAALRTRGAQVVTTRDLIAVRDFALSRSAPRIVLSVLPDIATSLEALRDIRHARPRADVICLGPEDPALVQRFTAAGAGLVLSKQSPLQSLVREVLRPPSVPGRRPFPRLHGAPVVDPGIDPAAPAPPAPSLTGRERDVLRLLVAARSTAQIATELGVSVPTTRGYIQSTFTKLGVHSRVEAVTYAVLHSLARP